VSADTTAPTGRSQAACVTETDFTHSFDCDDDESTDACNLHGEVDRYQDNHGKTTCCGRERKQHSCSDGCPGYGGVPSHRFSVFASPRDQVLRYDLILSIVSDMSTFGESCILPSSSWRRAKRSRCRPTRNPESTSPANPPHQHNEFATQVAQPRTMLYSK
jgi:hypothetical protein